MQAWWSRLCVQLMHTLALSSKTGLIGPWLMLRTESSDDL